MKLLQNLLYKLFSSELKHRVPTKDYPKLLAPVKSNGPVLFIVDTLIPEGTYIQVIQLGQAIFDAETNDYLGVWEEVKAIGTITKEYPRRNASLLRIDKIEKELQVGDIVDPTQKRRTLFQ